MSTQTAPTGISRIERNPRIQGGEPVVKGTRVTVASVVVAEREWGGVDGVRYAYPHLTGDQIADALAYYLEHRGEIDRYLRENADATEG